LRAPGHGFNFRRDALHALDEARFRIAIRIGRVKSIDVREQHQAVRAGHLGDAGGQAIVIAVANLGGGHRVIFVDDRNGFHRQQRFERGARIQIAGALLAVFQRQQNLRHRNAPALEQLLVRVRQANLPHCRGPPGFPRVARVRGQLQMSASERYGAG